MKIVLLCLGLLSLLLSILRLCYVLRINNSQNMRNAQEAAKSNIKHTPPWEKLS